MARIGINMKEGVTQNEEKKEIIVGIDLGTTNSLVAIIEEGKAKAIKGKDGKHTLVPSIVYFNEHGNAIVGEDAKEKMIEHPENTIYSVKRLLGRSYEDLKELDAHFSYQIIDDENNAMVKIRVQDKFYSPIELSAEILKYLKERIERELKQPISKAVITVPAYFDDNQRQATRQAGKLAGLDVLRILNEPTAASLAYGITIDENDGQKVVVYDLGGGTFDCSVLEIQAGVFEVLSTHGDTYLGGDDFDKAILEYWIKEHDLNKEQLFADDSFFQAFRLVAEKAKKVLSSQDFFSEKFAGAEMTLSRSDFNKVIDSLVSKTIDSCEQAMKDAGLEKVDIDHVILVGGSTRVPLVKERVSEYFEKPVNDSLNPDEVVALGAAIQADVLAGNNKDVLLLDITPLSLGIETVGGLMDVILPRNSKVPARVGRQYTTSVDGQTKLKVSVFQGERELVTDNRALGEFVLDNIPPMPAGLPKIEVHFIIDADGVLKVNAKELRSGVEQAITIHSQYSISEEEMAKMLIDSIQNAEQDIKVKALMEARNEANYIVRASKKFLNQHKNILSKEEYHQTTTLVKELEEIVSSEDKDSINTMIEKLNDYTQPLAHRAMDSVVSASMQGKKIDE